MLGENMGEFKIIQDPVHGPIRIDGVVEKLIDSVEFQRLRFIRQLGLSFLVFPGANHTRFEHSIGTMYISGQFSEKIGLKDSESLRISALLHDIGHLPFSHSFENFFLFKTGMEHQEVGRRIISGEKPFQESSIPGILESYSLSPKEISNMVAGKTKTATSSIISGPVDADELDYLLRDSTFCGIALGLVDYKRIINTLIYRNNRLIIEEKGIPNLESLLIGRILMYRSVYWHKTCRIAQGMMESALGMMQSEIDNPFSLTDHEFLAQLINDRGSSPLTERILRRDLFKVIYSTPYDAEKYSLIRTAMEDNFQPGTFLVDVIPPLEFGGAERLKTNMTVMVNGKSRKISNASPLVNSLSRIVKERKIMVSCERNIAEKSALILRGLR
jgi:HD superfamily phosphohydrolase